jgi:L-2-hydroxyglutarate oxidase LhgO
LKGPGETRRRPDDGVEEDVVADVDCLVVGGGVVGLAIARALALAGRETLLVEQEARFGAGTSSRNSGVIHSGIYYPSDSLKARLCVRGRDLLYAYAKTRGVPHRRCGKLIVATSDGEIETLEGLKARAEANGVGDLEWLDQTRSTALEPDIAVRAALFSPSTGIMDVQAFVDALAADAVEAGAILAPGSRMNSARRANGCFLVRIQSGEESVVRCRFLVNAAGLYAPMVARTIDGIRMSRLPSAHFARGNYFAYSGPNRFRHLVYPVPEPGGLGIHLTLDMTGGVRFGPDVEWIEGIDYRLDESRKQAFVASIRRYWPAIDTDRLRPDYAGIRPKIAPADVTTDFLVQTADEHGVEGLVNLLGIESPGLTSSLAIAEHVSALISD